MKAVIGLAVMAVGVGVLLCTPVVGAAIAIGGGIAVNSGVQPTTAGSSGSLTVYQRVMVVSTLFTGLMGFVMVGTMMCGENCAIGSEYSLIAAVLFFGAMAMSVWQFDCAGKQSKYAPAQADYTLPARVGSQIIHMKEKPTIRVVSNHCRGALSAPVAVQISEDHGEHWFTIQDVEAEVVGVAYKS